MIDQLFGSKTRVKLLNLFFSSPNRSFYVREITRKIDEQINSVRRELSNLLSIGIIHSENTNNRVYYEVNQKYVYYQPLKEIFGQKTPSDNQIISNEKNSETPVIDLKSIGHIELAVLTGQFTRDEVTGIDFFIIGDVNMNALLKFIDELEKKENKIIRYTVMKLDDFNYRQKIRDRFVVSLMQSKKQVLVDVYNLLLENKE